MRNMSISGLVDNNHFKCEHKIRNLAEPWLYYCENSFCFQNWYGEWEEWFWGGEEEREDRQLFRTPNEQFPDKKKNVSGSEEKVEGQWNRSQNEL